MKGSWLEVMSWTDWKAYFKNLLDGEYASEVYDDYEPNQGVIKNFGTEVKSSLPRMKQNRAVGLDGNTYKCSDMMSNIGVDWLTRLFNKPLLMSYEYSIRKMNVNKNPELPCYVRFGWSGQELPHLPGSKLDKDHQVIRSTQLIYEINPANLKPLQDVEKAISIQKARQKGKGKAICRLDRTITIKSISIPSVPILCPKCRFSIRIWLETITIKCITGIYLWKKKKKKKWEDWYFTYLQKQKIKL